MTESKPDEEQTASDCVCSCAVSVAGTVQAEQHFNTILPSVRYTILRVALLPQAVAPSVRRARQLSLRTSPPPSVRLLGEVDGALLVFCGGGVQSEYNIITHTDPGYIITHTDPGSFPRAYRWQRLAMPDLSARPVWTENPSDVGEQLCVSRASSPATTHSSTQHTEPPAHQHNTPSHGDIPTKPSGLVFVCVRVCERAHAPARALEPHYTGVTALIALRASTGMTRFTWRAASS